MIKRALKYAVGGLFILCAAAMIFAVPGLPAFAAKGDILPLEGAPVAKPHVITLGKADIITLDGDISDVLVANPDLIDVTAVQSSKLYVVGKQVGDTNLIALDSKGDIVRRIDIHVSYDIMAIQSLVDDLFPNEQVKVGAVHDQVLLTGSVSNPSVASRVANIVGHYVSDLQDISDKPVDYLISNLMDVRGEQQVMLQVRIVEANRTILKELGVDTSFNNPDTLATTRLFGQTPPNNLSGNNSFQALRGAGAAISQDPFMSALGVFGSGIAGIGQIGVTLQALEDRNLVNILAEPNLSAVSGETAGFLAGGEFPVPVGRDQVGNIIVEFREFGVSLNFKPTVLSAERISLQLNTEVSSLDFNNALTLAEVEVPGLDVRRADTTVEIPSGGSLMIAGLLKSDALNGMKGLPGISDTPIIGDLMSSKKFQRDESELIVIVTPYLVQPYAETERAQSVPAPENNPLADSFADNIRRIYKVEDPELFSGEEQFGYILD